MAATNLLAQPSGSLVNFAHLRHLTEKIMLQGDSVSIVHIYADAPNYNWTDAGDEGIACVDDAARAAVVYLRDYELNGNEQSREQAKSLLRFVMKMETDDGAFYNFLNKDHSINKNGRTSFKSFGWWAVRGVWCMSLGSRVLRTSDSTFAMALQQGVERTFPHIDSLLLNDKKVRTIKGYRIPQWLLYESGADATSELLLGLVEYCKVSPDLHVKHLIESLAEGLMLMQDGDITTYPYGVHRSWETMWHMWGNDQTQALASAGLLLRDTNMVNSAKREAQGFYSRLLIDGFMKEMDVSDSSKVTQFDQIAYGVRSMSVGLLRLYDATHDRSYSIMAGLTASWLLGDNVAHQVMYDSTSGRCFDGIRDSSSVNQNSGAESTIEALYTLVELQKYPDVVKYIHFRKLNISSNAPTSFARYVNLAGGEESIGIELKGPRFRVFLIHPMIVH
ncbi:MAG TPA: hypothetical protein VKS81_01050 [Bacteroidota bacterium]|nr:hypothetical protein [Bacteroidota bacterium]